MVTDDREIVSTLNDLVSICIDGIQGFTESAKAVKNPALSTLFASRRQSIESAKSELEAVIRRYGGEPTTTGHAAAVLHRGWLNLKSAVSGHNDEAILAEVQRGEEAALSHYEDASQKDLPADVLTLVRQQTDGVRTNLAAVRGRSGLADAMSSADDAMRDANDLELDDVRGTAQGRSTPSSEPSQVETPRSRPL